ncbi:hypothetical protein TIFTF001_033396 [Ficus carica]|uniref:Uncharacterized protein n=1 Tax=Ficus carica TaxID=3494 RepID=A0AA88DYG5_FICCA|nr:hypothetical protein TIFTF001_033396 [Ficus carica]
MASLSPENMKSSPPKLTPKLDVGDCDTVAESHGEDSHRSVATCLCFWGERGASTWEIFLSSRSPLVEEIRLQSLGEIATIHSLGRWRLQSPGRSRTFSRRGDQQRLWSSPHCRRRTITLVEANAGRGWGDSVDLEFEGKNEVNVLFCS